MLSYYIVANGSKRSNIQMEKTTERESQGKTSEIWEKEPMEQGGSSIAAVFCDAFFSCL